MKITIHSRGQRDITGTAFTDDCSEIWNNLKTTEGVIPIERDNGDFTLARVEHITAITIHGEKEK